MEQRSGTELLCFRTVDTIAVLIRCGVFVYFFSMAYKHSMQERNKDMYTIAMFTCLGLSTVSFLLY